MKHFAIVALLASAIAAPASASAPQEWAGAWGYATSPATQTVRGENPAGTYRYRIRASQSGDALRLVLTNPEGAAPLSIAAISIARAAQKDGFALDEPSRTPVTLNTSAPIAGGQIVNTRPAALAVRAGDDLIVEIVTSAPSTTVAGNAGFPAAFAPGTVDAFGEQLEAVKLRPLVTQMAVHDPAARCTIVTLGDSITEGARGTRVDWRG